MMKQILMITVVKMVMMMWMTSISATTLMMTWVKITALKLIDMIMMW